MSGVEHKRKPELEMQIWIAISWHHPCSNVLPVSVFYEGFRYGVLVLTDGRQGVDTGNRLHILAVKRWPRFSAKLK
jgi:hypothetical protein